ncbi:MAG TPA: glycoside hydrolase family 2 TIM barrel-domain containing protein [Thermomicrobiales bacterium]|nr:glycoside hydrolase family 2 TIM barrel-domain containing protein [Thermomicrobiales bacterium]
MTQLTAPALHRSATRDEIDLTGPWAFALDPGDAGIEEGWWGRDLEGEIAIPGSWEEQGYGERPPENIGGWTKRRSYEGAAWYQRDVQVPSGWAGKRVWLQLDRVGWQSTVWVNGQRAGACDSISTPHRHDLTPHIAPGRTHRVSIRVTNVLPELLNYEGHIHSRHTATTWGGIIGPARLLATPATWIERVAIVPDAATRTVRCEAQLAGEATGGEVTFRVEEAEGTTVATGRAQGSGDIAAGELDLGADARLWSDTDPYLYTLVVEAGEDSVSRRFGLRTFAAEGRNLLLNGRRIFLRGYVDCCIFPLTGYPPEDKAVYERQFRIAKAWGFNHVRLHTWVPSAPFFEAADEAGILVQCELPNWSNANDPANVDRIGDFLRAELDRVVRHLQPHPSLIIHSMGNELLQRAPGGMSNRYSPFLNELIARGKALDGSRLYIDQSGFGHIPEEAERGSEVSVFHTFRGSTPDTTATWWSRVAGGDVPVISHEHTQMDMYCRLDEIGKFTGIMEPSWLVQAREGLASTGALDDAPRFVEASGQLQIRCLKELFECIRRTPELGGVQMLNLTDFPGQGTALNGVLDVFWDEKGHIAPETFRRFNAETVLLCSTPRRTFHGGGRLVANLLVSHFGEAPLDGDLRWTLAAGETVIAKGTSAVRELPAGEPWPVGAVAATLPTGMTAKLTLTATLEHARGTTTNDWDFWVFAEGRRQESPAPMLAHATLAPLTDIYPFIVADTFGFLGQRKQEPASPVIVSDVMHVRYVEAMMNGATMLYLAENDPLQDGVTSRFESLFWSYLWFTDQPNQTMGLAIDDHPALGEFPHDGASDWQWFHLVDGATAVSLDHLPRELRPIVTGIDNWNRGKRLGYLLEARVGKGRFLMSTLKLLDGYPTRPEAVYLLDTLLGYVASDRFRPETALTLAHLWSIPKHPTGWPRP